MRSGFDSLCPAEMQVTNRNVIVPMAENGL
jgi:hypothetical protein